MKSILLDLKKLIPHNNWFIAGGAAASSVYDDIDIYFYTKEDYEAALRGIPTTTVASKLADTFEYLSYKIQYIKCTFGTPEELFATFDLNKSCIAILPTGDMVQSADFHKPLYIKQLSTQTMQRFIKYVENKKFPYDRSALVHTLSQIVAAPTIDVSDYYVSKGKKVFTRPYLVPLVDHYLPELCAAYDVFHKNERPYKALATFPVIQRFSRVSLPYLADVVLRRRTQQQPTPQMLEDYPDFFI